MTDTRRSFLALVGNLSLVGPVVQRWGYGQPTLVMPQVPCVVSEPAAPTPDRHPLLATHQSQMHAMVHIKRMIPDDHFLDWLEGGLRNARMFNGRDEATMERAINAAVAKHGSIIEAMRAGAI